MSNVASQLPVIIVGAGLVGLTLAQAFKKAGIAFEIYERDPNFDASRGGWGITIHWALPAFEECLPNAIFDKLESIQVDPEQAKNDTSRFVYMDLSNLNVKFEIPPSKRMRLSRPKLRKLLAEDIDIQWKKALSGFERFAEDGGCVEVSFEDGSKTRGSLLVGVDGANSRSRRCLLGESEGRVIPLDVRLIGVTARMTADQIKPLRDIDPLLFQGCHPDTGTFLWYSTVSTPESNGSSGAEAYFESQILLSWLHKSAEDNVPSSNAERLAKMKTLAQPFESRLRKAIQDLPEDIEVLEIKLQDWPTKAWNNHDGKVTLVGEAAHAMTMFRGQGVNHGIADAASLTKQLSDCRTGQSASQAAAIDRYEVEMRARAYDAVLLSRQACIDAHDYHGLDSDSPLVSKRAQIKTTSSD